jgi:hypothetical protein
MYKEIGFEYQMSLKSDIAWMKNKSDTYEMFNHQAIHKLKIKTENYCRP